MIFFSASFFKVLSQDFFDNKWFFGKKILITTGCFVEKTFFNHKHKYASQHKLILGPAAQKTPMCLQTQKLILGTLQCHHLIKYYYLLTGYHCFQWLLEWFTRTGYRSDITVFYSQILLQHHHGNPSGQGKNKCLLDHFCASNFTYDKSDPNLQLLTKCMAG